MRRRFLVRATIACLTISVANTPAAAQIDPPKAIAGPPQSATPQAAAKFYLDYDVPESPSFALLGATPTHVLRAGAAKPAAIALANDLVRSGKLATGIAIDVAPYAYVGRFRNVDEYRGNPLKRFLANLLVSFATMQAPNDSSSTAFAVGARATLHDDHDLIANTALQQKIGALLVPTAIDCVKRPGTNICDTGVAPSTKSFDVAGAYAEAREEVMRTPGWSASLGAAWGGTLGGGVPSGDSLSQRSGHAWLAATRYMGVGQSLLGIAEFVRDTAQANRFRTGVAYRMQSTTSAIAAELAYDSGAGGVLPGINAEMRAFNRVTLIAALLTDVPGSAGDKKHLRFKTTVRWSATDGF